MVAGRLWPLWSLLHPHGLARRRHLSHRRRSRRCGQRAAEPTISPSGVGASKAHRTKWRTAWRNVSQVERNDAVFLGGFVLGVAATRLANETTLPVVVLLVIAALAYLWWRSGQSSIPPVAPAAVLRAPAAPDDDDEDEDDADGDLLGWYQGLEGDGPLGRR